MDAQTFVNTLYGDADVGWLTVFSIPSRRTQWVSLLDRLPPLSMTENCYLGLGLRNQPAEKGRGKLEDIIGLPGLWLDLDWTAPEAHKATHPLPPDKVACEALLDAGPLAPSLVVHSGYGLQAYWLFNEVWYFKGDDDRARAMQTVLGWQRWYQAAGQAQGWHVDSTHDLTRVLRLPGTRNVKGAQPVEVRVLVSDGPRYEPGDFADYVSTEPVVVATPDAPAMAPSSVGLRSLTKLPDTIKYLILHGDSLGKYPSRSEAVFVGVNALIGAGCQDDEVAGILLDPQYGISAMPREKGPRWMAGEIARAHAKGQAQGLAEFGGHEAPVAHDMMAAELMAMDFPPIKWFAAGLLHEGMVLFGGKSKRGKSWIMMNLSLSLATGGNAFGHYEVPRPVKVLYCALEDGPRRTQRRMTMIDPAADYSRLKFAFRMPPLEDGGIAYIAEHIRSGYEVVVVDVLAHVEKAGKNGLRDYHEVYQTFAPLQALRSEHQFAMVMVTHLRKAESEEVFDNLHGSVAYQGAQDALWVLERKQGEENANLHLRDKDAEDKIAELSFNGEGIWSFVGEGEEHSANNEENAVIKFLGEEMQPQGIKDIMLGLDLPQGRYGAFRVRLHRMVSKGLILRTDRGKYTVLRYGADDGF